MVETPLNYLCPAQYTQISFILYLIIFTFVVLDTLRPLSRFFNDNAFNVRMMYIPELVLWFWQFNLTAEIIRKVMSTHKSLFESACTHHAFQL